MANFCCDDMKCHIYYIYENEVFDKGDVSDKVIYYSSRFDEFGLPIKDGLKGTATSYIHISHCPWCGKKLPESKREEWFFRLEKMGYDSPFSQDIPTAFKSSEWYKNN